MEGSGMVTFEFQKNLYTVDPVTFFVEGKDESFCEFMKICLDDYFDDLRSHYVPIRSRDVVKYLKSDEDFSNVQDYPSKEPEESKEPGYEPRLFRVVE